MEDWTNELVKEKEQVVYVNCNEKEKGDILYKLCYSCKDDERGRNMNCLYIGEKDIYELSELLQRYFYKINVTSSSIIINLIGGDMQFDVFKYNDVNKLKGMKYDFCILDVPFNNNNIKKEILKPICKKIINIIPKQFKIINSPSKILDKTKQYNIKDQIELEVRQLFQELLLIKPNSNNTMTREKIINMISKLVEMNEKL